MSEEETLKPCPFCGDKGLLVEDFESWHVVCEACGGRGPIVFQNRAQALIDWNRRTEVLPQKNAETTQNDTPAVVAAEKPETDVDFEQTPGIPELWRLLVNHKPIATVWNSPVGLNITWFDETQTLFTREGVLDFVNQRLYLEVK